MRCPNCATLSCYVCRQVIVGYDHFDQVRRHESLSPCGLTGHRCPAGTCGRVGVRVESARCGTLMSRCGIGRRSVHFLFVFIFGSSVSVHSSFSLAAPAVCDRRAPVSSAYGFSVSYSLSFIRDLVHSLSSSLLVFPSASLTSCRWRPRRHAHWPRCAIPTRTWTPRQSKSTYPQRHCLRPHIPRQRCIVTFTTYLSSCYEDGLFKSVVIPRLGSIRYR